MEVVSWAGLFFVVAMVALMALCVLALAFVPAWILWRITRNKRFPLMWVTSMALVVLFASVMMTIQRSQIPAPTPINQTLADVADTSGALRVTALRLPRPEQRETQIQVDAENTGDMPVYLGIQYVASSGDLAYSAATRGNHIWTVAPKWKGTLSCPVTLPRFVHGGELVVVLAKCNTPETASSEMLPGDSEALYQERFTLVPKPEPAAATAATSPSR